MSDEELEGQQSEEPASGDSSAVQAALAGIPGLAESMNRPPAPAAPSDENQESEGEEPEPSYGSRPKAEDSETVQQALRQFGLQ